MIPYKTLSDHEYKRVWEKLSKKLNFHTPQLSGYPFFQAPVPYSEFEMADYKYTDSWAYLKSVLTKLLRDTLEAREDFYCLVWEGEAVKVKNALDLELPFNPVQEDELVVICQRDMRWAIVYHPLEDTLTVFGDLLLNKISQNSHLPFTKIKSICA